MSAKLSFNPINLIDIMNKINVEISHNIMTDIKFYIENTKHCHNHVSFIINNKNRNIVCYSFNHYYKSKTFPFSLHSEINSITKYYKMTNLMKNRPKLILAVIKISKTGIIGMSKPCFHCRLYMNNNCDNLNIIKIFYSDKHDLKELNIIDLLSKESQHLSAGYSYKKNV